MYSTPAKLIRNADNLKITGVIINRYNKALRIQAKNGVVMATGGFENNQRMLEDYLGAKTLVPLGTLYNKGDGVCIAQEFGADLWHMNNFESLGLFNGMAFAVPAGERGRLLYGAKKRVGLKWQFFCYWRRRHKIL